MVERIWPLPPRLRTVFISDIHIGFKGCSADLLLDFLHHVEMDTLFFGRRHHRRAAHHSLLAANLYINWARRQFGLPHWSLSAYLKNKAKTAVQYIGSFEHAVAQAARKRGVDTGICGHIHRAEMHDIDLQIVILAVQDRDYTWERRKAHEQSRL